MYYLGIDIGGTSIKAGLVDELGVVSEIHRTPTIVDNLDALTSSIADLFDRFHGTPISGIGVGVPGLRSYATRVIETSPNIPSLQNVPLEALLTARLGMPVITENDAKAGAYGEWVRARTPVQHMAYITIGTGFGCGIVLHGKLYRGASGYAGELGHTVVEPNGRPCMCGSRGCIETRVSATAMVQTTRELMQTHPESLLHQVGNSITAQDVYDAAMRGDLAARTVFEETGRYLGIACTNLINLLNLEMIVIGGGVIASGVLLMNTAIAEARGRAFAPAAKVCTIVQSKLWPDAGLIGAAMLARDRE
jgi:glucokinase